LAFARRQELRPEAVDVAALVGSVIEMLRQSVGPTVQITTEFQTNLAPTRVDPNQLELALLNLAVNARDAMPDGGRLNITADSERVSAGIVPGLAAGEYIVIRVSDNGCGMDEATLKRASEPFFTTKDLGRGTGLGLSMVDGLAAQSGGAMRIRSKPGYGTTVELWFPISKTEPASREKTGPQPGISESRHIKVLVVDDDPNVLATMAAIIEDLGHSAIGASSAAGALDLLRSDREIDLVITDYAMPGVTGINLATNIISVRPGLPVAIATGYADTPLGAPFLARLDKPFRREKLAALIENLIERPLSTPSR
jgi:CheY-like chemotaxis protein/two-component sensor histidine kinase